jgi:hypothetical protein
MAESIFWEASPNPSEGGGVRGSLSLTLSKGEGKRAQLNKMSENE